MAKRPGGEWKEIKKYICWYDWAIIGALSALLLVCFLFPWDLWHTSQSSMAYYNYDFLKFYEYNQVKMGGNDYLPMIYWLFALWNLPLALFGVKEILIDSAWMMIYEKLFGAVCYFLATAVFYKICRKVGLGEKRSLYGCLIFLTTPYAMLLTFAWGMYDASYMLFIVIGLWFFIRERYSYDAYIAALLFGIAVSIKGVALFAILPLYLYRHKNVIKIAVLGVLTMLPYVLQHLLYWDFYHYNSAAGNQGDRFIGRLFAPYIDNTYFKSAIYVIIFIVICACAYIAKYDKNAPLKTVWIGLVSSTALFGTILWHPQWFMMMLPFMALLLASTNDRKVLPVDFIFTLGYLATVFSVWRTQFDEGSAVTGAVGRLISEQPGGYITEMIFSGNYQSAYAAVMTGALIGLCIMLNPARFPEQYKNLTEANKTDKLFCYVRCAAGVLIFLAPVSLWVLKNLGV